MNWTGIRAAAAAFALATGAMAGIATPRLHVEGNAIKDTAGNTVVLRGTSMIHAGWPYAYGAGTSANNNTIKNFLKLTDTTAGWYNRLVRVPVADSVGSIPLFPLWGTRTDMDAWVATHLQPLVDSAKARGVYVLIDYHLIEDVTPAKSDRCKRFWSYMAPKFADQEHVLYEVFNEPVNTSAGDTKWSSLVDTLQSWVDTIRTHAPKTIVLVAPPAWASKLEGINSDTITGGNIVYVAHMYPQNDVAGIKAAATTVAGKHPVFFSEWGFDTASTANIPVKGDSATYAAPFKTWADAKGISWTAWVWSGSWGPPMWQSDSKPDSLSPFGRFAKAWLYEKRNDNLPSGVYVPPTDNGGGTTVSGDSLVYTSFDMAYGQDPRQTDLAARMGFAGGGWWYTYHDDSGSTTRNGAGTDVAGDTAAFAAAVSGGALHVTLSSSKSTLEYPYTGLEANFNDSKTFYDLSKLTKVSLRLKGTVTGGSLRIYFMTRDVKLIEDWGNYGISTDLTADWSTVTIDAMDLAPSAYSAAATKNWTWAGSGALDVSGLGFSAGNGADADLWIDNITFYGVDSSTFATPSSVAIQGKGATGAGKLSAVRSGSLLKVGYELPSAGRVELRLTDMQGRLLASRTANQAAGLQGLELPMARNGMAVLQVRSGAFSATKVIAPVR